MADRKGKVEAMTDCIFLDFKIIVDGDCSHEINRWLLPGIKAMTNLDCILKSRDITLPTKVCLVKATVFPIVTYGCESWTMKKAECRRTDAFELCVGESHELQHARLSCPSPTPGIHPNPCPLIQWCHPTISSSVVPFSSCPQSFPESGYFPVSQLFASGGQSIGVSASTSVLPMNIRD